MGICPKQDLVKRYTHLIVVRYAELDSNPTLSVATEIQAEIDSYKDQIIALSHS